MSRTQTMAPQFPLRRDVLRAFALAGFALVPGGARAAEDPGFERAMIQALNRIRREHRLRTVAAEPRLSAAALDHARDCAARRDIDHRGRDGSGVDDRVARRGYRFVVVAENLAAGLKDAEAAAAAWMGSESHRRNMINPDVTQAGAARVMALDAADPYRTYDVLVLGMPRRS
ncbi:MAG: CAP domain-containing protein [Alphaproteobacteria bacterium]|nr:CAP domain-containing protein [Alphaproteobacteria bacterium]